MQTRVSRHVGTAALAFGAFALLAPARSLLAQGSCKGRPAEHTPACDTTPAAAPFAPTGWKTVAMDHFTMETADYKKESAYYATLMNWKVRSDDGKQAVLDIDDIGTVIIRGGYEAPPRPAPQNPPAGDSAGGGRRGGRGGNRAPVNAVWDSFAWQITPWDAKKVQAELEKRGLHPVPENDGPGCEGFRVTDPDGFGVILNNGCYAKARKANAGKPGMAVEAPFE